MGSLPFLAYSVSYFGCVNDKMKEFCRPGDGGRGAKDSALPCQCLPMPLQLTEHHVLLQGSTSSSRAWRI